MNAYITAQQQGSQMNYPGFLRETANILLLLQTTIVPPLPPPLQLCTISKLVTTAENNTQRLTIHELSPPQIIKTSHTNAVVWVQQTG